MNEVVEKSLRTLDAADGLPLQRFGAIVGAIYECVLEPAGWPAALQSICGAVGGAAGWIGVHYPGQVRSVYEIEVGTDPEWQRRLRTDYVGSSPFIGAVHYVQGGQVVSTGDVIDYDEFRAGRFYREWSAPQGWVDVIMGVLSREPNRFTWLGICLPTIATQGHKDRVAAFLPHVERALRISDLLEQRSGDLADLTAIFERLSTGILLVDADRTVHGANAAAQSLLRDVPEMALAGGALRLGRGDAASRLAAAISACAGHRLDQAGASVIFTGADGTALAVHVLPLPHARTAAAAQPVAGLFLTNPKATAQAPAEAFVARFGLTPSETRVLLAMIDGKSPKAIAAAQGVAMTTVRTHLSRIFEKTGTSGQTEVLRLLSGLAGTI